MFRLLDRKQALLALLLAGACDKPDLEPEVQAAPLRKPDPTPLTAVAAPSSSGAAAPKASAGDVAELRIATVGNTMAFDTKSFTVATGQQVHVVFKNNSSMELLPHNWVVVKPGTEATVAAAGLKAGESAGYLDPTRENVVVSSPLATKGASVEVTFTAPAPGTYPFICTVPGHYLMMKGTLVVTP